MRALTRLLGNAAVADYANGFDGLVLGERLAAGENEQKDGAKTENEHEICGVR